MINAKKIIVIGCSGSGKSTFSKKLAEITGLPLYNLDRIYWREDKTHLERPEFIEKQKEIMKTDRWIIDGNHRKTIEYRLEKCELAFFFDLPAEVCIKGVLERDIKREDTACELTPDERFINAIKSYREEARPQTLELFKTHPAVKVITFKSRAEADNCLEEMREEYGPDV